MKKLKLNFHLVLPYVVPYESAMQTRFLKRQRGPVTNFWHIPINKCADDIA